MSEPVKTKRTMAQAFDEWKLWREAEPEAFATRAQELAMLGTPGDDGASEYGVACEVMLRDLMGDPMPQSYWIKVEPGCRLPRHGDEVLVISSRHLGEPETNWHYDTDRSAWMEPAFGDHEETDVEVLYWAPLVVPAIPPEFAVRRVAIEKSFRGY